MNEQERNTLKNKINQLTSLDALAEYAIDALAEESPPYFHKREKAFEKEVFSYGRGLIHECKNLSLPDEDLGEAMEKRVGGTLDASCALNWEHFSSVLC